MFRKTYNILINETNSDQNVKALCSVFNYYGEIKRITSPKFEDHIVGILFTMKAKPGRFKRMVKVMKENDLEITPLVKNYYFI